MPEVVVLGSGTSNGVPMLGVQYPAEYLANPKNHRTRASIIIQGPEGCLLVDCSPELRMQMVREGLHAIDAVILTHSHADHIMGMDDLRSICIRTRRPMPVYTLPRYQEDVRRIFPYAFMDFPVGVEVPRFELGDISDSMSLCGMEVQTFVVMHGQTPVIGLRIGGFAYLTDVSEIPDSVWPRLEGLDTLILDAVRYKPHPNHFHMEKAIEVATALGARQTYFTHLSHDYDHDVTNAELPARMALAYDGLRIEI
jgi:phosphoribosyl 1,2-cyclic phosphate phosphodiesterase